MTVFSTGRTVIPSGGGALIDTPPERKYNVCISSVNDSERKEMYMKRTGLLLKVAALLAALLMLTTATAFAQAEAPADWDGMVFSLTWFDGNGEQQTAQAVPVYEQPGSIPAVSGPRRLFRGAGLPVHNRWRDGLHSQVA